MHLLLLLACKADPDTHPKPDPDDSPAVDDSAEPVDGAWTLLVYIVGDNDLETYVVHDLNELERGHPGGAVRALVLADRSEDYVTGDGDWTGTRLYEIVPDDGNGVKSTILEEWGEVDMADPATLSRFLDAAATLAPAEHVALSLWNHGSAWYANVPPPGIGWDDSSGSDLSIAEGELDAGLRPYTEAHGPFAVIAFDACNMAFFEVAHALREHGQHLVAAQTTVGSEGLQYTPALLALQENPEMSPAELANMLARDPVELTGEWTFSTVDLGGVDALAAALDGVASLALEDPGAWAAMQDARDAARGSEPGEIWRLGYLDMGDFAAQLAASEHVNLAAAGAALRDALTAVSTPYGAEGFTWTSGLNLHAATYDREAYTTGAGATWVEATLWDEVLARLWREEQER